MQEVKINLKNIIKSAEKTTGLPPLWFLICCQYDNKVTKYLYIMLIICILGIENMLYINVR